MISVCSPNLTESELDRIRKQVMARIPDPCLPELVITEEEDYGINGVIDMCMTWTNSKLSLVDETGL